MNDWDVIGQITKLGEGFVLVMHGRSYACRDAKELGAKVGRIANRRPKTPFGAKTAEPILPPEQPPVWEVPAPPTSVAQAAANAEKYRVQTDNLYKLVAARFDGNLDPDDLEQSFADMCPDLTKFDLLAVVEEFEQRLFEQAVPDPNAENALGPDCSCQGCKMNVSTPNAWGMCRGCHAGEHQHPTNGQVPVVVPKADPEGAPWWMEPDDADVDGRVPGDRDNDRDNTAGVAVGPDLDRAGPGDADGSVQLADGAAQSGVSANDAAAPVYGPGNDEPTPDDERTNPEPNPRQRPHRRGRR